MKNLLKILTLLFITLNISSCSAENYKTEKKRETNISQNLKIKIDNILQNFYKKLDKKFSKNSDKKNILEKINIRINFLKQGKSTYNKKVTYLLFNFSTKKEKNQIIHPHQPL